MKTNKNENECLARANDIAQLRAENKLPESTKDESGALAAASLFGFVELSERDRYNIARYTGWKEEDLHGLLISKCKDFLAIPDKKNYLVPRMGARQHWKTLAETKNVTIMQSVF